MLFTNAPLLGWFGGSYGNAADTIMIPRPMVKIGKFDSDKKYNQLFAYYINSNQNFLSYNPKYYLFHHKSYKKSKRVTEEGTVPRIIHSGFYHPTHQNGINFPNHSSFFSGGTEVPLDTEFNLDPGVYAHTLIPFDPYQFTRCFNSTTGRWEMGNPSLFPSAFSNWKIQGKKGYKVTRSSLFCLAIGITNPDVTKGDCPILFSDLSHPFRLSFFVTANQYTRFNFTIPVSSVKRNL